MRSFGLVVLLAFALPAQAQLYKCVDARGKTQYSDKPIPGCRAEKTTEVPAPPRAAGSVPAPAAKAKTRTAAPPVAKTQTEAMPPEHLAARCRTLREEQEWLNSAAGKAVASHTERVAQVEQALRACH